MTQTSFVNLRRCNIVHGLFFQSVVIVVTVPYRLNSTSDALSEVGWLAIYNLDMSRIIEINTKGTCQTQPYQHLVVITDECVSDYVPLVEGNTCASCACQKRVARNGRLWPRTIVFCFVLIVWRSAGRCACVCTRRTWKSTSNRRWRTATRSERLVPVRARLVHCPPASGLFNVLRQLFAFYYKSSERGAFIYRLTWLLFKRRRCPLNDVIYVTVLWDERAPAPSCILVLNGSGGIGLRCLSVVRHSTM